jgi:hypothetical protein
MRIMTTEFDRDEVVKQVTQALAKKLPEKSEDEIRAVVADEVDALSGKPVRDYVSVLSERAAKKRLKS